MMNKEERKKLMKKVNKLDDISKIKLMLNKNNIDIKYSCFVICIFISMISFFMTLSRISSLVTTIDILKVAGVDYSGVLLSLSITFYLSIVSISFMLYLSILALSLLKRYENLVLRVTKARGKK